jgi:hypothetical protein
MMDLPALHCGFLATTGNMEFGGRFNFIARSMGSVLFGFLIVALAIEGGDV